MTTTNINAGIKIRSWSDVDYYISEIREKEVEVVKLQRQYDDGVLKLQKKYIDHQTTLKDELEFTKGKIQDFCDNNRKDMDDQKKKVLSNGEVYYRDLPLKIKLMDNVNEGSVIQRLKGLGQSIFKKYVSIKYSVSLTAIKKDLNELSVDEKFINEVGLQSETGENFNVKANP